MTEKKREILRERAMELRRSIEKGLHNASDLVFLEHST